MGENVTNDDLDGQLALDWRIAICLGLDMTQQATADAMGVTRSTVSVHMSANPRFFDYAIATVRTINAQRVAKSVTSAVDKAEVRIKLLFDRAFVITERLVQKAEKLGDDITLAEAMEIHKNITVWTSKFAASEAPKRFTVDSKHTEIFKVDDETFDRLDRFMASHANMLTSSDPMLSGETIDVKVIPQ